MHDEEKVIVMITKNRTKIVFAKEDRSAEARVEWSTKKDLNLHESRSLTMLDARWAGRYSAALSRA